MARKFDRSQSACRTIRDDLVKSWPQSCARLADGHGQQFSPRRSARFPLSPAFLETRAESGFDAADGFRASLRRPLPAAAIAFVSETVASF
jgi:hypothetical protein